MQARKGRDFLRLNWIRVEFNDWECLGPSVPHTILTRCLVKQSNVLACWVYHSRLVAVFPLRSLSACFPGATPRFITQFYMKGNAYLRKAQGLATRHRTHCQRHDLCD